MNREEFLRLIMGSVSKVGYLKNREEIINAEGELVTRHSKNKFQHKKSCCALLSHIEKMEVCQQNVLRYLAGLIFYTE